MNRTKGTDKSGSNVVMEYVEPQITSSDPNERKLARKLRIERRLEAFKRQTTIEDDQETIEEIEDPVFQQVQKSTELLEKLILEGDEYITNVRIASDSREVDRRESEGVLKDKIMEQLENEATAAKEMFDEIASKWAYIQQYNDPLHIHEDIGNQKEKCSVLMKQKDDLITMLKDELKLAEIKYADDQRKQIQDVNTLADRIESQIILMRKAYQSELELIESVILEDRQAVIDGCDRKWEELYDERDLQEESNMREKFDQIEKFEKQLKDCRQHFQEYYRATKIQLENNVDELERELERVKALALLNTEKLDYNYQILKKREDENIIIKSQQKRRINKLQDLINAQRHKIKEYEQLTDSQITKLEVSIEKLQSSIVDVEGKADHFAQLNDKKFMSVWRMNEDEAKEILNQILAVDNVLHEQLLGRDWIRPNSQLADKTNLASYRKALKVLQEDERDRNKKAPSTISNKSKYSDRLIKEIFMTVSDKAGFLAEERLRTLLKPYEDEQKALIRIDHVFEALKVEDTDAIDMLVDYFLPYMHCPICSAELETVYEDERKSQRLYSPSVHRTSEQLLQAETSLISVNAQCEESIKQPDQVIDGVVTELTGDESVDSIGLEAEDQLSTKSILTTHNEIEASPSEARFTLLSKSNRISTKCLSKLSIEGNKRQCSKDHPLCISSVYVLQALMEFVENYHVQEARTPSVEERLSRRRDTISRLISEKDMNMFWERFQLIFDKNRERIWDAVYTGLHKYHDLLKERKGLCEDVVGLRRQNAELKKLLGNYLVKESPSSCGKL